LFKWNIFGSLAFLPTGIIIPNLAKIKAISQTQLPYSALILVTKINMSGTCVGF